MSNPSLYEALMNHNALKRVIVQRSFDHQIPLKSLCEEVGANYKSFMDGYINEGKATSGITEEQFLDLIKILGMSVRYQVMIDTSIDMKMVAEQLNNKYRESVDSRRREKRKYNK